MMTLKFRLLSFLLLSTFSLFANTAANRTLSNLHVNSICEDSAGYIWIGTARGLCKYNGYEYKHYYHDDYQNSSLPSDYINAIFRDSKNRLWISTHKATCLYREESDNFLQLNFPEIAHNNQGFYEYDRKMLCYGYGIQIVDMATLQNVECSATKNKVINTLLEDAQRNIWIGCGNKGGIQCLGPALSNVNKLFAVEHTVLSSFKFDDCELWFGTEAGIIAIQSQTKMIIEPSISPSALHLLNRMAISVIEKINDHQILIGTQSDGLFVYDIPTQELRSSCQTDIFLTSRANHITCTYKDKLNNIWIGSFDKGYSFYSGSRKKFNNDNILNNLINGRFVTCITEDNQNNIWIGTRYSGLLCYNKISKKINIYNQDNFIPFKKQNSNFVQVVFFDEDGFLWFDSGNDLLKASIHHGEIKQTKIYPMSGSINTIIKDRIGNVWIGLNNNGLYYIEKSKDHPECLFRAVHTRGINITRIRQLSTGEIIFSNYLDNIYTIDPESKTIKVFSQNKQLMQFFKRVIDIYESKDGTILMASYGKGFVRYNRKTDHFYLFLQKDGLPSNDILSFAEDQNNNLWISTSFGLCLFDTRKSEFTNFYEVDGTSGNQYHEKCSFISPSDQTIYFGGNHGLTYFIAEDIQRDSDAVPVIIEGFTILDAENPKQESVLNKVIDSSNPVILDYDQNIFSIDFVGIDYAANKKIHYAYKLENFDNSWISVGDYRRAIYSKVPAGHYRFHIKAQNSDGIWNAEPVSFDIVVKAAPWRTPLAIVAYILLLLSVIIGILNIYINYRSNSERAVFAEKERQKDKEISQMKIRFFTNISHELRTPLTMIYGPVKQLLNKELNQAKSEKALAIMNQNVIRILRLIDQLCDFGKLESDTLSLHIRTLDIIAPMRQIIDSYTYHAEEKEMIFSFHSEFESLVVNIDFDKVDKILNNLLSNAFKYTPHKGEVSVNLKVIDGTGTLPEKKDYTGRYLQIEVADNGSGVKEDQLETIFDRYNRAGEKKLLVDGSGIGLHYVKCLVEKHRGHIQASLGPQHGMIFTFILPIDLDCNQTDEELDSTLDLDFYKSYDLPDVPQLPESEKPADVHAKSILIVEDNAEVRMFIKSVLENEYSIGVACNGQEGYDYVQEVVPDLILSDVRMPVMDGYQFCHQIKTAESLCHIPFIMLTAKTTDAHHLEGYLQGADYYLNKPFNPDILKLVIRNIFISQEMRKKRLLNMDAPELLIPESNTVKDLSVPEPLPLNPLDQRFMDKLFAFIDGRLDDSELDVTTLYQELGFSRTSFYRKIKALTGESPNDFLRVYRLNKAAELIRQKEFQLNQIGEMTGFNTHSHFSTSFKKQFGMSPSEYSKKA